MNELALFSGAGGGILGGTLLGWRTVCAVEIDAYAASVLLARQNDGILPPFPVWDDIRTFDGKPWRGIVDVVSGGFPCQDISCAGKGTGIEGERSGLWKEMARVVREVRPEYVFVENSPMLTLRGLDIVLGDLAAMGYDAEWGVLGADDAGAPHIRKRIWILAYSQYHAGRSKQRPEPRQRDLQGPPQDTMFKRGGDDMAHSDRIGQERPCGNLPSYLIASLGNDPCNGCKDVPDASIGRQSIDGSAPGQSGHVDELHEDVPDTNESGRNGRSGREPRRGEQFENGYWWLSEPDVGRVANGVAARVDRLKAIGNGQVPAVAALAFKILYERINQ